MGYVLYTRDPDKQQGLLHLIAVTCQLSIETIALFHVFYSRIQINRTGKLMIAWLSYALIISILFPREFLTDIRTIFWWPSVFLLFFYIAKNKDSGLLSVFIRVFLPIIFIGNSIFFILIKILLANIFDYFKASVEIYYIVSMMPLAALIRKKSIKYLFFAICILFSLYSFKRGAQLCVLFAIVIFILTEMQFQRKSPFRIVFLLVFVLGGSFFVVSFVNERTGGYVYERFDQMEETGGSGREYIYSQVIQEYAERPFYQQLMGIGMGGVKAKYHITNIHDGRSYSAHNDFLEMLVDYGLIGLILYLRIIIGFISNMMRSNRLRLGAVYQMSFMAIAIFLTMSMVSHLFLYPSYVSFLMIPFGIVAGMCSRVYRS